MVLSKIKDQLKEVTKKGRCLTRINTTRYGTAWNPASMSYEFMPIDSQYCAQFEKVTGLESAVTTAGELWRLDPQMATVQQQGNRLVRASSENDLSTVKKLLQEKVSPGSLNISGNTGLIDAAYNGHTDIAKYLLVNGASVNQIGRSCTALHTASLRGKTEMVKLLLAHGADANAECPFTAGYPYFFAGNTPLHSAALTGEVEAIKMLIESGARVDSKTSMKITPLMTAAWMAAAQGKQVESVKFLLKSGADINAVSDETR